MPFSSDFLAAPTTTLARQALPQQQIVFGQPTVGASIVGLDPLGFRLLGPDLGQAGVDAGNIARAIFEWVRGLTSGVSVVRGAVAPVASTFTGGATGTEPGVLGLPTLGGVNVGFLDTVIGGIGQLAEIAAPFFMPQPGVTQAGIVTSLPAVIPKVGGAITRALPGIATGVGLGELLDVNLFGNGGASGRVAGVQVGSLFHSTPAGLTRPNRVSLMEGPGGQAAFFVHAGRPLTWSKVSLRKSRPRHHHHPR